MNNLSNMPSVETLEAPIQEGDAALVLKKDGSVEIFSFGIDKDMLEAIGVKKPEEMSTEELDLALQGQKLYLLTMAANSEAIMDFLGKVSDTTGSNDLEKMQKASSMH